MLEMVVLDLCKLLIFSKGSLRSAEKKCSTVTKYLHIGTNQHDKSDKKATNSVVMQIGTLSLDIQKN